MVSCDTSYGVEGFGLSGNPYGRLHIYICLLPIMSWVRMQLLLHLDLHNEQDEQMGDVNRFVAPVRILLSSVISPNNKLFECYVFD